MKKLLLIPFVLALLCVAVPAHAANTCNAWQNGKAVSGTTVTLGYSGSGCQELCTGYASNQGQSMNCGLYTSGWVAYCVVGSGAIVNGSGQASTCTYTAPTPPTSTFTVNGVSSVTINKGQSATLGWSSVGATSCTGTNFSTGDALLGSSIRSPLVTTTYTLTCSNTAGNVVKTVTITVTNQAPNTPSISGPTSGLANTSYPFTISGTDPTSDELRYGVDWDANGSVDEWLPASGYVASGTTFPNVTHSWTTTGTKTIKVKSQDAAGAESGWATFSIVIGSPNLTTTATYSNGATLTVTASALTVTLGQSISLTVSGSIPTQSMCSAAVYGQCNGYGCNGVYVSGTGSGGGLYTPKPSCVGTTMTIAPKTFTVYPTQTGAWNFYTTEVISTGGGPYYGYGGFGYYYFTVSTPYIAVTAPVPAPTVDLTATPTSVASGNPATLKWTSTNADTCTGTNFSTGGEENNQIGVSTGNLTQSRTYTILCEGDGGEAQDSVTVTVTSPTYPPCYGEGCSGGAGGGPTATCLYTGIAQPSATDSQCCSTSPGVCPLPPDPPAQCEDGIDNDGNGLTDLADTHGCSGSSDDNESTPEAAIDLTGPTTVVTGTAATLTWSASNVESGSCRITSDTGYNSGALSGSGGTVGPTVNFQTLFTLRCTNLSGSPVTDTLTVQIQGSIEEN